MASETRTVLPDILKQLPGIHAAKSESLHLDTLPPLKASSCPKVTASGKATIRIVNEDTLNAAISLASSMSPSSSGRVAVLNMASHAHPGGGWLRGALAQEEALCYRSSLSLSLHRRYYPWKQRMGIYTPDVVVIRSDMPSGHRLLLPDVAAHDLPVVSVLSIAALCRPQVKTIQEHTLEGKLLQRQVYADPASRLLTKAKMRLCLRAAASRGHRVLVLGALGCGAFHNPREEVAMCWLEVLREDEFQGGWWEEMVFAVFDSKNEGNFETFDRILGGVEI